MASATQCTERDVDALVSYVVVRDRLFAAALAGEDLAYAYVYVYVYAYAALARDQLAPVRWPPSGTRARPS